MVARVPRVGPGRGEGCRSWPSSRGPFRLPPSASTEGSPAPCANTTSPAPQRRGRRKTPLRRRRATLPDGSAAGPTASRTNADPDARATATAGPPGTRPSTGPQPHPDWLVTELAARTPTRRAQDRQGGRRPPLAPGGARHRPGLPAGGQALPRPPSTGCSTATPATWRAAGSGESRENRAMANRTRVRPADDRRAVGERRVRRALPALAARGVPVPYPVQLLGTELLMEFIGDADDGTGRAPAGPVRPDPAELADLWEQLRRRPGGAGPGRAAPTATCRRTTCWCTTGGWSHRPAAGRRRGGQPAGPEFLARDVRVVATWFTARGLPAADLRSGRPHRAAAAGGGGALTRAPRTAGRPVPAGTSGGVTGGSARPRTPVGHPVPPGRRRPPGPPGGGAAGPSTGPATPPARAVVSLASSSVPDSWAWAVDRSRCSSSTSSDDPVQDGLVVHAPEPGTGGSPAPAFGPAGPASAPVDRPRPAPGGCRGCRADHPWWSQSPPDLRHRPRLHDQHGLSDGAADC